MATLKELMGDLTRGDGRKFKSEYYSAHRWFEPIYKSDVGTWYGLTENGSNFFYGEDHYENWEPYIEPKKKVKLYQPICRDKLLNGNYFAINSFVEEKNKDHVVFSHDVVGWVELEAEVDE